MHIKAGILMKLWLVSREWLTISVQVKKFWRSFDIGTGFFSYFNNLLYAGFFVYVKSCIMSTYLDGYAKEISVLGQNIVKF